MEPRFVRRLTAEYKRMVDNEKCPYTVELKDGNLRDWIVTIPGLNLKLSIAIPVLLFGNVDV